MLAAVQGPPAALDSLRQLPHIPEVALAALACRGWCEVPNYLPQTAVQALWHDAQLLDEAGLPRHASVGSTLRGATAVRRDDDVRVSRMLPLIPPPRNCAGHVSTRLALADGMHGLRQQLEGAKQLDVPPIAPFATELAYLYYPEGGLYKRHMDVPAARDGWIPLGRRAEDGGSFSRAALRREISMLLYLDAGWDPAWGGHLRVYEPDGDSERKTDVIPEGGTLVLMRSDKVPHEVLKTRRPRRCLVGWFRTSGEWSW